jgi:hypothetical protein
MSMSGPVTTAPELSALRNTVRPAAAHVWLSCESTLGFSSSNVCSDLGSAVANLEVTFGRFKLLRRDLAMLEAQEKTAYLAPTDVRRVDDFVNLTWVGYYGISMRTVWYVESAEVMLTTDEPAQCNQAKSNKFQRWPNHFIVK